MKSLDDRSLSNAFSKTCKQDLSTILESASVMPGILSVNSAYTKTAVRRYAYRLGFFYRKIMALSGIGSTTI